VIHVLATKTYPCLHYEFNEVWVFSNTGDVLPESTGGRVRKYTENYPNGARHATWCARICPNGRYLLEGLETTYYENGRKDHEVTYSSGRKAGVETYWAPDGTKLWSWMHHPEHNVSKWIHYWDNGRKRIESNWNTKPSARDLDRHFFGLVANGPVSHWDHDGSPVATYSFTNGCLAGSLSLPAAEP
jgi:antitoxin component YwqK of YwqJK toxin-antitoxin module